MTHIKNDKLEKSPSPVYGARLELVYGLIAHRGFESLLLRQQGRAPAPKSRLFFEGRDFFLLPLRKHVKETTSITRRDGHFPPRLFLYSEKSYKPYTNTTRSYSKKSDSPKTVRLNFYGDYSIVVMSLPNQAVDISASFPSCFISWRISSILSQSA